MKVYLASSWRNSNYESVREYLILMGYEVYDFKNPEFHFHWFDISKDWECWDAQDSIEALKEPMAQEAFKKDFGAILQCDAFVLLNPSGKSAHLEAGYAKGVGKPVFIFKHDGDPELMYLMADGIFSDLKDLVRKMNKLVMKSTDTDFKNKTKATINKTKPNKGHRIKPVTTFNLVKFLGGL